MKNNNMEWLDEILTGLNQYNLGQDPITDEDFTPEETYAIYPELKKAKAAIAAHITEAYNKGWKDGRQAEQLVTPTPKDSSNAGEAR